MALPERLPDERRAVDGAEDPVWVASKGVNTDDVATTRDALDGAGVAYRLARSGTWRSSTASPPTSVRGTWA